VTVIRSGTGRCGPGACASAALGPSGAVASLPSTDAPDVERRGIAHNVAEARSPVCQPLLCPGHTGRMRHRQLRRSGARLTFAWATSTHAGWVGLADASRWWAALARGPENASRQWPVDQRRARSSRPAGIIGSGRWCTASMMSALSIPRRYREVIARSA